MIDQGNQDSGLNRENTRLWTKLINLMFSYSSVVRLARGWRSSQAASHYQAIAFEVLTSIS
ncbi:putative peroxygenase 3 -like protein [Gossypium arboreum]|uniref:Putative peroxygenase 3-like protein n=1 Tax=Gossypium arboreum TaxID=29729 RepID=A0A0B0NW19_GOSAR|nr:putative peroxygenase 3 -like protein [Gossypium arboreum]